ncbi:Flavohemoprotein [Roseovarius albus]|uniref:Flavohemoprotein n=1 Tax=Roseovarius albus TaxID=1247867 RepID=A0A1X6YT26_9RHOB|nr:NO-inducible flavohemoprotein [Roseovarius albus]SLN30686.1 Flavohemoprotein [Roseovarius albus]
MAQSISESTKAIVTATVPALEAHGRSIVTEMYARLLADDEIRVLFNQSHQGGSSPQHEALTNAILAYAKNIDNLGALAGAVERIANKHVGLQIQEEHYEHVANALIGAIAHVLGDAATDEVLSAWGEAYWFLAGILIGREKQLYQDKAQADGGWEGWREFRISERRQESGSVMSFILKPVDGRAVLRHQPGQYLSFDFDLPGVGRHRRNYSISSKPNGEYYRITVKREPGGAVSGWLHEQADEGTILRVAPPAGDFMLKDTAGSEVVLLSAGVGLTPMVSMLETLAERGQSATYLHATVDGTQLVMGDIAKSLAGRSVTFFETPNDSDRAASNYDVEGRISPDWLAANTAVDQANYYICGPKGFMVMAVNGLKTAGVPQERIHFEFFGPASDLDVA